jgi:hypothetical protein
MSSAYQENVAKDRAIAIYGNVTGNVNVESTANSVDKPDENRCLHDLRITDPKEDKIRLEDSNDKRLKECYSWLFADAKFRNWHTHDESRLLWIKGGPGKGKTMMMIGLIEELSQGVRLPSSSKRATILQKFWPSSKPVQLSYFFCQSTKPELNSTVSVLRGLVYRLVADREDLRHYVQKPYGIAGKKLFEDFNAVSALKGILSDILNDKSLSMVYLLIDALDECTVELPTLLRIISDENLVQGNKVKWVVTSRNLPEIGQALCVNDRQSYSILELSPQHVGQAVKAFIKVKVHHLASAKSYPSQLKKEVQQILSEKAEDTFLWVSLVCKTLMKEPLFRTMSILEGLEVGLDPLYATMAEQTLAMVERDPETAQFCKDILQSAVLAYRPLQLKELAIVAKLPSGQFETEEEVADIVNQCGSFLNIHEKIVSLVHLSAKDYLMSGNGHQYFNCTKSEGHLRMLQNSFDAMNDTLRKDMCNLKNPGTRIQEAVIQVGNTTLRKYAYAYEYWIAHLQGCVEDCRSDLIDGGKIHKFLQEHLLHWLEAMSLLQKIPEAVEALHQLHSLLSVSRDYSKKLMRPLIIQRSQIAPYSLSLCMTRYASQRGVDWEYVMHRCRCIIRYLSLLPSEVSFEVRFRMKFQVGSRSGPN